MVDVSALTAALKDIPAFKDVTTADEFIHQVNILFNQINTSAEEVFKCKTLYEEQLNKKSEEVSEYKKLYEEKSTLVVEQHEYNNTQKKKIKELREMLQQQSKGNNDSDRIHRLQESLEIQSFQNAKFFAEKQMLEERCKNLESEIDLLRESKYQDLQNQIKKLQHENERLHLGNMKLNGDLKMQQQCSDQSSQHDEIIVRLKTENVRFGEKKPSAFIPNLSNILISYVKQDSKNVQDVRIGDFVIELNEMNVQNECLATFKNLQQQMLVLKLRRRKEKYKMLSITGYKVVHEEWGMSLGIFIKSIAPSSFANTQGLREYDEIVQVNGHEVDKHLAIKDILKKMNRKVNFVVKQRQVNTALKSFSDSSSSNSSNRRISQFSDVWSNCENSQNSFAYSSTKLFASPPGSVTSNGDHSSTSGYISLCTTATHASSPMDGYVSPIERHSFSSSYISLINPRASSLCSSNNSESNSHVSRDKGLLKNEMFKEVAITNDNDAAFDWEFAGGNKVGIFVLSLSDSSPAAIVGVKRGWKLKKIEGYLLQNVALGFAKQLISSLQSRRSVKAVFETTSEKEFYKAIARRPHDFFYVKTLTDYKTSNSEELSFLEGETLCITDSYVVTDNGIKWKASKEVRSALPDITGLVPNQLRAASAPDITYSQDIYKFHEDVQVKIDYDVNNVSYGQGVEDELDL